MAVETRRLSDASLYDTDPFYKELDRKLYGERKEDIDLNEEDDSSVVEEFGKGFSAGIDQTQALGGGALAALGSAFGFESWVETGLDYYQEQMNEAAENAPAVNWEDDFEGIGDAADFFAYTLGNVIPSLATTIAGGGVGGIAAKAATKKYVSDQIEERLNKKFGDAAKAAAEEQVKRRTRDQYRDTVMRRYGQQKINKAAQRGAVAGGGVTSAVMGAGENFARIYEETGLEDPAAAISLGIAMGALDTVGAPFRAFKRMFPDQEMDGLKSFLSEKAIEDRNLIGKMFDRVSNPRGRTGAALKEAGIGAVREGVTEATQEWLSRTSVLWASQNLSEEEQERFVDYLSSEDAMSNYLHSMVAGVIAGGALGGTIGAVGGPRNKDGAFDPKVEEQRAEVQAAQREAAAQVYDEETGVLPPVEGGGQFDDVVIVEDDSLFNALSAIEESGQASVQDVMAVTDLDLPQQQEMLDILDERGYISQDIDENGAVTYALTETGSDTLLGDVSAREILGPETETEQPEISVAAEEEQAPPAAQEEAASTDPVVEETGFGSETKVTYPTTGNTYRINQYAQDAGGGFFATLPDRTTVDLEDTLDASIQAVGRIESGAATDPEAPDLQLAGLDGLDREFAEMDSAAAPQQRDIAGASVQQPPPDIVSGDVDLAASVEERAAQVNAKAGQTQQQIGGDDDYVVPRLGGTAALVQQIAGKGQAPQVSFNNGESQVTLQSMSEYYNPQTLDDSQPVKAALNAVINAVERGLPADVMDTLTGFYVYQEGQDGVPDDASAAYFRQNNSIGFGINALESRAATPEGARGLINSVAHEVWHAADTKKGYTDNLPGLRAEVVVGQDGKVSVDMGAVTTELFDAWDSNSELGQFFDYPFGHLYQQAQDSGGNTGEISNSLKREVFAQLGAVYIANPKLLKDNAPKAYKIMRDLQADPRPVQEIRDARKRAETETPLTRSAEVQGDVRSPTGTGIVQVSDEGGAGGEGDASGPVGTAGQELGGTGIDQDGDQSGRVLRDELDQAELSRVPLPQEDAPVLPMGKVEESLQALLAETNNNPTKEQLSKIVGAPKPRKGKEDLDENVEPRTLEELRSFIRESVEQSDGLQWYDQFGRFFRDLVGDANLDEASVIFGVTSAQNSAEQNLADTLHVMAIARRVDPVANPKQFEMALRQTPRPAGQRLKITGNQIERIIELYRDGQLEGGIKTTTYMQMVADRGRNIFNPFSVQDVHMARVFGFNKKEIDPKSGNAVDAANIGPENSYRYAQYLTSVLADEFGISPNQTQALLWFYAKTNLSPAKAGKAGTFESAEADSSAEIQVIKDMVESGSFDKDNSLTPALSDGVRPSNKPAQKTTPFSNVNEREELMEVARSRSPKIIASAIPGKDRGFGFPDDTPLETLIEYNDAVVAAIVDEDGQIPMLRELGISHEIESGSGSFTGYEPSISIRLIGGSLDQAAQVGPVIGDALLQDAVITAQPIYKEDGMPAFLVEKTDGSEFTTSDGVALTEALNPEKDPAGINFNQPLPNGLVFIDPKVFDDSYDYKDADDSEFYGILQDKLGDGYSISPITQDGAYFDHTEYDGPRETLRGQEGLGGSSNLQDAARSKLYEPAQRVYREYAERLGVETEGLDFPEFERVKAGRPETEVKPEVQDAYQALQEGRISKKEYSEIVSSTVRPYESVPEPATVDEMTAALNSSQATRINEPVSDGENVGIRLDINAYLRKENSAWVATIHGAGKPTYRATAALTSADLTQTESSQSKAKAVMEGRKNKSPFAKIEGEFVNRSDEENARLAEEALNDPAWTQIGYDPRRKSYFYDRDNGDPILSASEVIQIGPLVLGKNVERGEVEQFDYQRLSSGANPEANFNLQDEVELEARLANKVNEKFREKVVDRYERWRTVEDAMARELGLGRLPAELSFRDAENLMHSRAEDQLQKFEDKYITGIAELAREFDLTVDQIGLYLLAKHAPERNAQMLQKERDRREKRLAQLEKQLEDSVSDTMPDGSPAVAAKIEALNAEPFRHIETGSGMTNEQAQKVIDNTVAAGNQSQYEQIATAVYKMLDDMRQNMVDKGLLDEETRNDWQETYEFYVPLKGFLDAEGANTSNPRAKGFNIQGSESMKARGRVTLPQNPLLNAFKDAEEKIVRAEKNFAAQKLLRLVEKFEAPGEWSVWSNRNRPQKRYDRPELMSIDDMKRATRDDDGMPKYVQVKRGGQTFFIELKDARLNRQIQQGNAKALNQANELIDFSIKNLRKFQNFRRNVIINWNPSWFFINPLRDIETGLAFLLSEQTTEGGRVQDKELIGKVISGWAKAGKGYYAYKRGKQPKDDAQREIFQYIDDFIADGAPTGLATSKSLEEIQASLEKTMPREIKVRGRTVLRAGSKGKLGEWKDSALDWVEHANQSSENAIRLSTYIEARKAGTPRLDAATLAKDLTVNFNRKGEWSSTIDTGYLFFNAAIQGNVNIKDALQAEGADPKVKAAVLTATAARKLAMGLIGFGFARTMANIMLSDDDDDEEPIYNDFNKFKLASTQAIVIGENAFGAPLPYGWGWFDNVGRIFAEQMMGVRDPAEGATDMLSVTAHHFAPRSLHAVNEEDDSMAQAWQAASGLLPDVLLFGTEQGMNVNFFGSPIVLPTPYTDAPASSTSKRGTMELFKSFASTVNELTGGSEYTKGAIDIAPDRLQHFFDFMLGGLGRFGTDAFDTAQKTIQPEGDLENADVPIWRNFVFNPSEYNDQFRYYDNRADTKRNVALWENSDRAERRRLIEQDSADLYTRIPMMLKAADKKLRANRKEMRRLEGLAQGDKRAIALRVRKLEAENQLIYDKFNKAFKAAND